MFPNLKYRRNYFRILFIICLAAGTAVFLTMAGHGNNSGTAGILPVENPAVVKPEMEDRGTGPGLPALLLTALEAGGVQLDTFSLEGWGCLYPDDLGKEEINGLSGKVKAALGLEKAGKPALYEHEDFYGLFWEGELEPGVALFYSLQSIKTSTDAGETYLLICLESSDARGEEQLQAWRRQVVDVFWIWRVEPYLTYNLTGFIPGKIDAGDMKRRGEAIMAALEVEKPESFEDTGFLSMRGYSPLLPETYWPGEQGRANTGLILGYQEAAAGTYLQLVYPFPGPGH